MYIMIILGIIIFIIIIVGIIIGISLLAVSLRDGAAEVLAAKVRKSNDVLDEELRKAGYVQNRQKQVVNVGMAKQAEAKKVYYGSVPFEGSVQITSRILGSMANSFFSSWGQRGQPELLQQGWPSGGWEASGTRKESHGRQGDLYSSREYRVQL